MANFDSGVGQRDPPPPTTQPSLQIASMSFNDLCCPFSSRTTYFTSFTSLTLVNFFSSVLPFYHHSKWKSFSNWYNTCRRDHCLLCLFSALFRIKSCLTLVHSIHSDSCALSSLGLECGNTNVQGFCFFFYHLNYFQQFQAILGGSR